jgi:hypothetical protein
LLSAVIVLIETDPNASSFLVSILEYVDVGIAMFFLVDLSLRFISYHEKKVFFKFWVNTIDLIALVPFMAAIMLVYAAFSQSVVIRILKLARIISLLKVARHFGFTRVCIETLQLSSDALLLLFAFLIGSSTIFAAVIFVIERGSYNPETGVFVRSDGSTSPFGNIPTAIYWAITTVSFCPSHFVLIFS